MKRVSPRIRALAVEWPVSLQYKPLDSVSQSDLLSLIENSVCESLCIEYKLEVFDKRDERKRVQFLGSVSAFANTNGGDMLIGVRAADGVPQELVGLDRTLVDGELLRIIQVIGSGIQPQLVYQLGSVELIDGRVVIIIRIPKSWNPPHGIEVNQHFQFFRRNAAGRAPMTLTELRSAFNSASALHDSVMAFRERRIRFLTSKYYGTHRFATFHVIPFSSISGAAPLLDLSNISKLDVRSLSPARMQQGALETGEVRYNIDGVLMRDRHDFEWHTQLFRNGVIEFAARTFFDIQQSTAIYLNAWLLQITLVRLLRRFVVLQSGLNIRPPVAVITTLMNASRCRLRTSQGHIHHGNVLSDHDIEEDEIVLPDVVV